MTGPDILDDTTGDYERLEAELVAQNREATRVATADADGMTVHRLVGDLVEDDVVTPVPNQRVLVDTGWLFGGIVGPETPNADQISDWRCTRLFDSLDSGFLRIHAEEDIRGYAGERPLALGVRPAAKVECSPLPIARD